MVQNFLVYVLFVLLERSVPLFPLGLVRWIARIYGTIFYYVIPIRRTVAIGNLKLAFPEKSDAELNTILKEAYINIFTVIFEFFYFKKLRDETLRKIINVTNLEIIGEKLKDGKGLILICAHFGNWELAALGVSHLCGEPIHVIVKEQTNKLVDKRINKIRELRANKMIDMEKELKSVLTALRENKIVAMLSDQSAPKENSVKINFFVKDVPTFEGAARFALKTGAAVLFGVPVRGEDGNYSITLEEIYTGKYDGYNEENIKKLTQEHTDLLADYIRMYPAQWLWFHRRFKNLSQRR